MPADPVYEAFVLAIGLASLVFCAPPRLPRQERALPSAAAE